MDSNINIQHHTFRGKKSNLPQSQLLSFEEQMITNTGVSTGKEQ